MNIAYNFTLNLNWQGSTFFNYYIPLLVFCHHCHIVEIILKEGRKLLAEDFHQLDYNNCHLWVKIVGQGVLINFISRNKSLNLKSVVISCMIIVQRSTS